MVSKKRNLSRNNSVDSTELVAMTKQSIITTTTVTTVAAKTITTTTSALVSPPKQKKKTMSSKHQQQQKGCCKSPTKSSSSPKSKSKKQVVVPAYDITQYVAIDCEMVGIGMDGLDSALARVVIIDYNNEILLDQYVKPDQEVVDYRTYVSGITPQHLQDENNVVDFVTCQKKVLDIVKDKVIVGHGLKNDLSVLQIQHPWYMIRDTAKYEPFMKERVGYNDGVLWPRKLKELCTELLHKDIQPIGQSHSPYEDSVAAFDLYKSVATKWESLMKYKQMKTAQIIEQQQQKQQLQSNTVSYHQSFPPLAGTVISAQ